MGLIWFNTLAKLLATTLCKFKKPKVSLGRGHDHPFFFLFDLRWNDCLPLHCQSFSHLAALSRMIFCTLHFLISSYHKDYEAVISCLLSISISIYSLFMSIFLPWIKPWDPDNSQLRSSAAGKHILSAAAKKFSLKAIWPLLWVSVIPSCRWHADDMPMTGSEWYNGLNWHGIWTMVTLKTSTVLTPAYKFTWRCIRLQPVTWQKHPAKSLRADHEGWQTWTYSSRGNPFDWCTNQWLS